MVRKEKIEYESDLMRALNFTEADLNAHRDGYLLQRHIPSTISLVIRDIAILVASGIIIYVFLEAAGKYTLGLWCIGSIVVLVTGRIGMHWLFPPKESALNLPDATPLEHDLFDGQVAKTQGELVKRNEKRDSQSSTYELQIGGRLFFVSEKAFEAFLDRGYYAVYYLPRSQKVISAELLSLPEGSNKP